MPGMRINCDSLAELGRFDASTSTLRLGLRVNPLVSSDSIGYMNVGTSESKFGEALSNRDQIISACLAHEKLDCLHVHLGSQFSDFSPTINGIGLILKLADDINEQHKEQKINTINIGGGFPVNYFHDKQAFEIEHYVAALRNELPRLFDGSYALITEFGRYVHANAGWCLSRIEYVKPAGSRANLITHLGADMFLRECYNPGDWHHEMFLIDAQGNIKGGTALKCDVAGPLCFGGDFIRRSVDLPEPSAGDWLAVQDTGANTFSLWSRHCSRQFPKVITCNGVKDVRIAKQRESIDSIINFWS
jgi:diaminopimelate decarboxylase